MKRYVADFETITDEADARVWAWAVVEVGNIGAIEYGNRIETFIDWLKSHTGTAVYFHNLKFDGMYIVDWLLKHDWKHHLTGKNMEAGEFNSLISDMGQWYSLKLCIRGTGKHRQFITIYDSYKLLPYSVEDIANAFKLPMLKGEIDYNAYREVGHELTDEEKDYIHNDVCIVAQALQEMFNRGFEKMTIGSNALTYYKELMGKQTFERRFPPPVTYDHDIRQSYRGGWTYVNPKFAGQDIDEGIVLDVNSLFPSQMRNRPMPFGVGVWFKGEYVYDEFYPLYIQHFRCQFEIKEGYLPTYQIHFNPRFSSTEYALSSEGEYVDMCMTSVDLKLFLEHYNVYNLEWCSGWKFQSFEHAFDDYIDFWTEQKIQAKKEGNAGLYTIAKLFLNSLYGKFATAPTVQSKNPILVDDVVKLQLGVKEERTPVYLPVGTFITAYARDVTIRSAQKVYDRFLYADTDSLHLKGLEVPAELDVDDYKLGAWKHESTFHRARFLHAKCYIEETYVEEHIDEATGKIELKPTNKVTDKWIIKPTIAGLPHKQHNQVTWENFHLGAVYTGKLLPHTVEGGVVLKPVDFRIKG